jgi:hypothetical protein
MHVAHSTIQPFAPKAKVSTSVLSLRAKQWMNIQYQKGHEDACREFAEDIKELQKDDQTFEIKPLRS